MKKSLFLLLPLVLTFSACTTTTSSSSSEDDPFAVDKVTVYFFESATKFDTKNPYYSYEVELGAKLTAPEVDPTSTDPAFNTFLGWSNKPIIMSEEDLWDFENDKIPNYIPNLKYYIYGQWDYLI